jgi:inner membrane protein
MTASRLPSRSLGLKFLLVCALAIAMSIPAYAVFIMIYERTSRAEQVIAEVGQTYGGEQAFMGPVLIAPYRIAGTPARPPETGWYVVFAETGRGEAVVDTDVRSRGDLFKVRTYAADLDFTARFDLTGEPSAAPDGAVVDWSRAAIIIGVADPRGAQGRAEIRIGDRAIPLEPGSVYGQWAPAAPIAYASAGGHAVTGERPLQWLAADLAGAARPGAVFEVSAGLRFTGVESLSLGAFARNTDLRMRGDWADVGYFGAFPATQGTPEQGFEARWSIPYVGRGVAAAGAARDLTQLAATQVQVRFIDGANPYQAVTRSLKYALLFLGVVFLAYFLFEATSDRRVHPAQYVLVGLAQIIFYLLLLALAERIGFDWAFLTAALATVLLIAAYLGQIFRSRRAAGVGFAAFALLYALIYLLMRIEDYALLAGAVAAFIAVAAVMYFTRNLDWYGLTQDLRAFPQRQDGERPS